MIGDSVIIGSEEFEVVFDGRQSLLGERDSNPIVPPAPYKRLYTRTGKHSKKAKPVTEVLEAINANLED